MCVMRVLYTYFGHSNWIGFAFDGRVDCLQFTFFIQIVVELLLFKNKQNQQDEVHTEYGTIEILLTFPDTSRPSNIRPL